MAEFIPSPKTAAGRPVSTLRQDVHLHAPYDVVRTRLLEISGHGEWLADHFQDYEAEGNQLSFKLALPGRIEAGYLTVDDSDPFGVRFVRNGTGGEIAALNWAIHVETARDVHLTVEAVFEPRGGLLGPFLELAVLRPQRTQALRESIWRLKQVIERDHPRQPII
jgi:hypothetical protein